MRALLLIGLLLLGNGLAQACEFSDVSFKSDFEMAKLDTCSQLSDGAFMLETTPENRPINHSPWYAFKVLAKKPKDLEINLRFDGERPRYLPKISHNGRDWSNIDFDLHDGVMTFYVKATTTPLWIAGQELFGNQKYSDWLDELGQNKAYQRFQLGKSTQGRPIGALLSTQADNKEWLILLGRQHPPEVTGALAMLPFTEMVLSDSPLAQKFRARFNIFMVPNLNPDGVTNGHWRHNVNGIDLNRDWKNFNQIETRIVRDKLNEIVASGGKMVMGVDFHSTQQDVFYTIPTDYTVAPSNLVEDWLAKVKKNTASSFVVRNKPGVSPGRGVFKQYFTDTYKVHAITYEMGDNTNRKMITHVAKQAANTLMETMLATPSSAFYFKDKTSQ
ncbi:M14 family metallopeptidase [uncultured Paraglaciecola sp.]|uniref:M14 family metallopeptidase n=1 Tax=uncultured Paraglaciecola sp. TaxID=1765024 RepID=UPI002622A357|nr:M14 family metallopeptidase [uncultured Paraglaciecola sp.]